jgi:hypothetical protein
MINPFKTKKILIIGKKKVIKISSPFIGNPKISIEKIPKSKIFGEGVNLISVDEATYVESEFGEKK